MCIHTKQCGHTRILCFVSHFVSRHPCGHVLHLFDISQERRLIAPARGRPNVCDVGPPSGQSCVRQWKVVEAGMMITQKQLRSTALYNTAEIQSGVWRHRWWPVMSQTIPVSSKTSSASDAHHVRRPNQVLSTPPVYQVILSATGRRIREYFDEQALCDVAFIQISLLVGWASPSPGR